MGLCQGTVATETGRLYAADARRFRAWAAAAGLPGLPCDSSAVTAYVYAEIARGHRAGTIRRRIAAVRRWHADRGLPDPVASPAIQTLLRVAHASTLEPGQIRRLVDAARGPAAASRGSAASGLQPWAEAVILLGFTVALAAPALAALQRRDVAVYDDRLSVTLASDGHNPRRVDVPATHGPYCPVAAVGRWITIRDRLIEPSERLFVASLGVRRQGWRPCRSGDITSAIRRLAAAAGLPGAASLGPGALADAGSRTALLGPAQAAATDRAPVVRV